MNRSDGVSPRRIELVARARSRWPRVLGVAAVAFVIGSSALTAVRR